MAVETLSSVGTAIGVTVAARQLSLTKLQEQSRLADGFAAQYRRVVANIPLSALLGQPLEPTGLEASLRAFYEYFDLSNLARSLAVVCTRDSRSDSRILVPASSARASTAANMLRSILAGERGRLPYAENRSPESS